MNDGMIGFDPYKARMDIQNFYDDGIEICDSLIDKFEKFLENIHTAWCSPNAVSFKEKYGEAFPLYVYNLYVAYNNVAVSATKVYNIHAQANNVDTIEGEKYSEPLGYNGGSYGGARIADIEFYDVGPTNGIVGMNKAIVKQAFEVFKTEYHELMVLISNRAYDIAFFDENGSQQEAYRSQIAQKKAELNEEFDKIVNEIEMAINNEIDTMELAKQNAMNTLNG